MPIDRHAIEQRFTYHPPLPGQPERYQRIREKAKELALVITALTPESREQSLAITALEEASMWANAAIARHEVAGFERPINQEESEAAHWKEEARLAYQNRDYWKKIALDQETPDYHAIAQGLRLWASKQRGIPLAPTAFTELMKLIDKIDTAKERID